MEIMIQTKEIPITKKVDVVVAGGGPAGVAAAIASARLGVNTLLIEKEGYLGGMGTAALVNPFMTFYSGKIQLVKGIFEEVINTLKKYNAFGGSGHPWSFDTECLKYVLNELALESGVKLQLHSFVADTVVKEKKLKAAIVENKSGRQSISAKVYIDCTGDGDLAARSGAEFKQGRELDKQCQPASLMFKMGGVEADAEAVEYPIDNEPRLPQGRVLFFKLPRKGEIIVNMTRITQIDGTNADDLTRAEIEGRKQVQRIIQYLKDNVKGFESSYLIQTGATVGIRETRRIVGEYVLTTEDVLACKKFDDAIAHCAYMIDIHNPNGQGTEKKELPEGQWYDIPYRSLLPKGYNNLLVAGRCISSTHEVHSSLRIQPTCYALGQAAGTGAALAVKQKCPPHALDIKLIQKSLAGQNVL